MRYFISDYAQFGGKEMLSLNKGYEISYSHLEEPSDSFADLGFFLFRKPDNWKYYLHVLWPKLRSKSLKKF